MKNLLCTVLALALFSCNTNSSVGFSKDAHGCNSAAGQSWSKLKNECIQVFNEGKRLDPVKPSSSAVISAFVLVSSDGAKTELYLPGKDGSIILRKTDDGVFTGDSYKYSTHTQTLYQNEVAIYKSK